MTGSTRRAAAVLGAIVLWCGSTACASDTKHDADNGSASTSTQQVIRGEVVSTVPLAQMSTDDTMAYLKASARNGVDAYRVVYRTIDTSGAPTTASGLVALPRTESRRLRVVSYEHGTLSLKSDAPSVNGTTRPDRARTIMFAAAGYAAVAPDYLGLGEGPGFHPYTHAPTEVSASVDLLRAARTIAAQQQREFDPDILVTGFSQGGQAATALGKALQAGEAPGFGLAALAPISGPYDVRNVETPAGLDGRVIPASAVFYFAYWLTSMNRIHHLYDSPAEAFQEPYASKVEELFDGNHNEIAISAALLTTPQQLLTPKFIAWSRNPTGAALKALADTDGTCDWTPRVPVRLYAASGDRSVPYANSEHCLQALRSDKATLVDLGDIDHGSTARVALPQILEVFQQEFPPT
ncbi:alpha/beta fold hydrolase [Nocardia sp. GCM10030253]|uniref:alpha/beta fold hydrolase n=1 Tax=Nocardia sp. GCM10030253 TaxID=3273404 RepID=UPI00362AFB49